MFILIRLQNELKQVGIAWEKKFKILQQRLVIYLVTWLLIISYTNENNIVGG